MNINKKNMESLTKQYLVLFKEWIKYKLGDFKSLSVIIDGSKNETYDEIKENLRKLVFLAEYWWYKKFISEIISKKSSAYILILLERLNPESSELKLTEDTKELKGMIETLLGIQIDRKETGLYYQGRGGYWNLGSDQDMKDHLSLLKILLREAIYRLG